MRILILEDDNKRILQFRQKFIGHELDVTKDPKEANSWLEEKEYDAIFLDHDLAEGHYEKDTHCKETTGLCTAIYLGERVYLSSNATVVIHSCNPNGAKRMAMACRDREPQVIPFPFLLDRITMN